MKKLLLAALSALLLASCGGAEKFIFVIAGK